MIMFQERAMRTHLGILPVVGRTRHKVRSQQRRSCNTEELLTAELSEGSQQSSVGRRHHHQPRHLLQHWRQFNQRMSWSTVFTVHTKSFNWLEPVTVKTLLSKQPSSEKLTRSLVAKATAAAARTLALTPVRLLSQLRIGKHRILQHQKLNITLSYLPDCSPPGTAQ